MELVYKHIAIEFCLEAWSWLQDLFWERVWIVHLVGNQLEMKIFGMLIREFEAEIMPSKPDQYLNKS